MAIQKADKKKAEKNSFHVNIPEWNGLCYWMLPGFFVRLHRSKVNRATDTKNPSFHFGSHKLISNHLVNKAF